MALPLFSVCDRKFGTCLLLTKPSSNRDPSSVSVEVEPVDIDPVVDIGPVGVRSTFAAAAVVEVRHNRDYGKYVSMIGRVNVALRLAVKSYVGYNERQQRLGKRLQHTPVVGTAGCYSSLGRHGGSFGVGL